MTENLNHEIKTSHIKLTLGKFYAKLTCTWLEAITPGPSWVQISSVLMVSKLQSPIAEMSPSAFRS